MPFRKRRCGFTLMEVVIATFIVAVGVVALVSAFLSGLILIESSRGMAQAASDARSVFEEMRRLSAGGTQPIITRDWTSWSRSSGLTGLSSESVTVSFRNPADDPLEAKVTVNWSERNRNRSTSFTALITKR